MFCPHVWGQDRVLSPLEQELGADVSHYMGAGNQTDPVQKQQREANALNHWAISADYSYNHLKS